MRIGVDEPAEGGRAKGAAVAMALDISASRLAAILGQTSRDKTLHVVGDAAILTDKLERL